jgi:hypothetical protein
MWRALLLSSRLGECESGLLCASGGAADGDPMSDRQLEAELADLRANEHMALRRLSNELTNGNAGTWDELGQLLTKGGDDA